MGDELKVSIPKYAWKSGATRAITSELRKMADKFGLDMATAQQAQGVLWIKGEQAKIEAAKPTLRELVQTHFPDADMPEELQERAAKSPKATPKSSPAGKAKASPKVAPASPAKSPKKSPAAAPAAEPALPPVQVTDKKLNAAIPGGKLAASAVPGELLWLCMVKTSSFLRRRKGTCPGNLNLSAEPGNIAGMHSYKYSTVAHSKPLGLEVCKEENKEKVTAIYGKGTKGRIPRRARVRSGVSKCKSKGLEAIRRFGYWYRRDLASEAKTRYQKIVASMQKRKRTVRSRRMKK
eukprot:TRINITY_DN37602_c0_g1_i1.p1 TRINITY_DN37602_c0_g1~~TRINITY_DN37602_c0_g1_i1.p1  ORF type:complete len:324 (-),score=89.65 TRINITY_DN37602_c0_g1_i1:75-953(-)